MLKIACLVPIACLATRLVGCGQTPVSQPAFRGASDAARWQSVADCLMLKGINLNTPLIRGSYGGDGKETIQDKRKELGAYAKNRKLYDRDGKEIRFVFVNRGGPNYLKKKEQETEDMKIDELRRKYTIVVLVNVGT
jgi:hypothetical protein